jgi:hypothetical protein
MEEFDRNCTEHPYISVICLNTLGVYISQSEEIYHHLKKQLSSKGFLKKVTSLFTSTFYLLTIFP